MAVFFDGRLITTPTTASVVNDDAMRNQNLGVGNVAVMVGRSAGGKPKTALRFGSPEQAKDVLVSGELLEAVLAAFDPSQETGGPTEVVAVRVNPATQASGVIKESLGATVINLSSTGYGKRENQIAYKIEAGTLSGLRVTTQRGSERYTRDNLERRAFSVQYTGSETTATIDITGTSVVLNAPAGTPVQTIDLTLYPTVQELVDAINVLPDFDAAVLDRNYTAPTVNGLDFVTAASVKTSYVVKADLQAVIDWINSAAESLLTATRASGAGAPPAVAPFTYLTGASDGTTTFTDWSDAYEALQTIDAQWITPVSGDAAIHAMNDSHCAYMSTVGLRERRSICGTPLATTDEQAIAAAKALNSDRTSLVHLGHYEYDASGKLVLFPPYISAARLAGAFSGVNPGTPLTNKLFKCRGLERDLRNPTDTDVLIQGGVLCLENTDDGYKVVQSISTWLANDNYNRVEQSTGVALDFTARNVRKALDVLRGQKGNPLVLSRAISITQSTLKELAKPEPQGPGVLAGDDQNPAFRNITASLEGDVLRVQYECSPVIPVNYVLVTIFAVPFTGSAAA